MKGSYKHNVWGSVLQQPRAEKQHPIPEKRELNLISGMFYEVEIIHTNSYDSTVSGRRTTRNKMRYIDETEHFYIFEYESGLRECLSKSTPPNELKITQLKTSKTRKQSKLNCFDVKKAN